MSKVQQIRECLLSIAAKPKKTRILTEPALTNLVRRFFGVALHHQVITKLIKMKTENYDYFDKFLNEKKLGNDVKSFYTIIRYLCKHGPELLRPGKYNLKQLEQLKPQADEEYKKDRI